MKEPMEEFSEEDYARRGAHFDKMMPWDLAWNAVVAICIMRGTRPSGHGTGTLLKIADQHFVITAAHVIQQSQSNLFMIPAKSAIKAGLVGEAILGEQFDVGVLALAQAEAEKIPQERFLRLDSFSLNPGPVDALYAVLGFPEMMFRLEENKVIKYFHVANGWDGDPTHLPDYNPKHHFHISAELDGMRGLDGKQISYVYPGTNVPAQFPKELKGISGGPVWKIVDTPDQQHDGSHAKIVGVECSVFQTSQCIRAVKWGSVLQMIAAAKPELERSIALHLP